MALHFQMTCATCSQQRCACRDTLGKLLRFSSSKSGDKLTSLQEVVSRMQPNQKDIYFVATETKEAAESSPFVERLAKKDFEVSFCLCSDRLNIYCLCHHR